MQARPVKIHFLWNHLTAVAAFLLAAFVNVAAAGPGNETRFSNASAKQLEATAGPGRAALAFKAARLDRDSGDADGEPAILTVLPVLYSVAPLPSAFLPSNGTFRHKPFALRAGLTRAPPSI